MKYTFVHFKTIIRIIVEWFNPCLYISVHCSVFIVQCWSTSIILLPLFFYGRLCTREKNILNNCSILYHIFGCYIVFIPTCVYGIFIITMSKTDYIHPVHHDVTRPYIIIIQSAKRLIMMAFRRAKLKRIQYFVIVSRKLWYERTGWALCTIFAASAGYLLRVEEESASQGKEEEKVLGFVYKRSLRDRSFDAQKINLYQQYCILYNINT